MIPVLLCKAHIQVQGTLEGEFALSPHRVWCSPAEQEASAPNPGNQDQEPKELLSNKA